MPIVYALTFFNMNDQFEVSIGYFWTVRSKEYVNSIINIEQKRYISSGIHMGIFNEFECIEQMRDFVRFYNFKKHPENIRACSPVKYNWVSVYKYSVAENEYNHVCDDVFMSDEIADYEIDGTDLILKRGEDILNPLKF